MHDNYVPRPVARSAATRPSRARVPQDNNGTAWARLWRSVASRTGIDLEHPFADEDVTSVEQQRANRREFREWERRFQVAAHAAGAGAANRIRVIAPARQQPEPESQEEIRAWNAFEKARLLQTDGPARGRRKRRSREATPEDEAPAPTERKRKRPRLLRVDPADLTDSTGGESSRAPQTVSRPRPRPERIETGNAAAPGFLQSLLDEVETVAANSELFDVNGDYFPYGAGMSDQEGSPTTSNHASPRGTSPPPPRPSSPTLLTSNIEPIYPPPPEFPPGSPVEQDSIERARSRQRQLLAARQSPGTSPVRHVPLGAPPPRQTVSSPPPTVSIRHSPPPQRLPQQTRPVKTSPPPPPPPPPPATTPRQSATTMSSTSHARLDLDTKTAIQALVKAVLKPVYTRSSLTKDDYTVVNRDVSRKLYEVIGSAENFARKKGDWEKIADDLVHKAVEALGKKSPVIKDGELPIR
jgi:hypothetical protein